MSTKRFKPRKSDRRKGPRRRTVLVDDWRSAYKWLSVQIAALIFSAQGLLLFVPTVKELFPPSVVHGVMMFLAACVFLGRIKNQAKPEAK